MIFRECIGDHIWQIISLNDLDGVYNEITDKLLKQLMICYKYITNELNINLDRLQGNNVVTLEQTDIYSDSIPILKISRYCNYYSYF